MPRKKSLNLTDAELRLMEVLWAKGYGTVSDVADGLPANTPLAYSSVLTTLRVLESKGYLTHRKQGRAFVYRPVIGREQASEKAIAHLLRRFFQGSPELLMMKLVGDGRVKPDELTRLKARLEKARASGAGTEKENQ